MGKIQTLFSPGSYGTYLSWATYTFSDLNKTGEIVKPFTNLGSAHLYRQFSIEHKLVIPTHDFIEEINQIIFIRPHDFLEYFDNQFEKQSLSNEDHLVKSLNLDLGKKLQNHWQDSNIWQKRELWSYYLPEVLISTKEQFQRTEKSIPEDRKIFFINSYTILDDLNFTLTEIFSYFNLKQTVNEDIINSIHTEYISLQKNRNKTQLVQRIVDDCLDKKLNIIPKLTIFDEAIIQHLFRNMGIEMKCYGLNEFPKNTIELYKVLDNPPN